jgi:Homeodomain-like domain
VELHDLARTSRHADIDLDYFFAGPYTGLYHVVIRAKIVLLAAAGWENTVIADRLDVPVQLVSKWRKRCYEEGLG